MPPAEQVYRATPFPHDPPPEAVSGAPPASEPGPAPEPPPAYDDEDGDDREDGYREDAAGTGRSGRRAGRPHGRRARRGRGKRVFVLAVCLGTVLLGMSVGELGAPGMPWTESASTEAGPEAIDTAGSATSSADDRSSEGTPSDSASTDASDTPDAEPTGSASASPSAEASPSETGEPSAEPTEVSGSVNPDPADPTPTQTSEQPADPKPPDHSEPDEPDEPDDDYDCWLIFCG